MSLAASSVERQSLGDAVAHDTELIADAHGWTIDEAKAHLNAAAIVGDIAVKISINRPDAFVGSVLPKDPRGDPILLVKGSADSYVRGLADDAPIAIAVADNQPYSFDELEARKRRVQDELRAMGYDAIAIGVNITGGGAMTASIVMKAGAPSTAADAESRLPADLRGSIDLKILAAPKQNSELTAFGGMRISHTLTPMYCTGGWTVRRISDGLFGNATAGHCQVEKINHPGHGTHDLEYKSQHGGQWGDVEWSSTNVADLDDFYADTSLIRDVFAVEPRAGISVGEAVCFYGRTSSDRDCSLQVQDVSIACWGSLGDLDRLVLMDGIGVADFGDSGGGFSVNNTAYGVLHGGCDPEFPADPANHTGWISFSVADLLDEALGVRVYTG